MPRQALALIPILACVIHNRRTEWLGRLSLRVLMGARRSTLWSHTESVLRSETTRGMAVMAYPLCLPLHRYIPSVDSHASRVPTPPRTFCRDYGATCRPSQPSLWLFSLRLITRGTIRMSWEIRNPLKMHFKCPGTFKNPQMELKTRTHSKHISNILGNYKTPRICFNL